MSSGDTMVVGVTPPRAAKDPKHPAHAQWVKDRTLKLEADHAQRSGIRHRDAEASNAKNLERLAARQRGPKKKTAKKRGAGERKQQRELERKEKGVWTTPVAPIIPAKAASCNKCGQCLRCKREARMLAIAAKARLGDTAMAWLMNQSFALILAAKKGIDCRIAPNKNAVGGKVPFGTLPKHERARVFTQALDSICDWSVRSLGAWR